jgi:hypothetical protein
LGLAVVEVKEPEAGCRTTTRLSEHKTNAFVTVSKRMIKESDKKLNLPPRLVRR